MNTPRRQQDQERSKGTDQGYAVCHVDAREGDVALRLLTACVAVDDITVLGVDGVQLAGLRRWEVMEDQQALEIWEGRLTQCVLVAWSFVK